MTTLCTSSVTGTASPTCSPKPDPEASRGCRLAPVATTIYYCASSLDGYIAEADDSLDWLLDYQGTFEHEAASEGGGYEGFYGGVRALVAGSVTYEWILDHLDVAGGGEWPYRGKPFWVLSSRELRLPEGPGVDVQIVDAPVGELYGEMAAAAGDGVLWVVGGGNVASQFADEGLIDEVHVTVVPVVLGAGKRLFERRLPSGAMQLTGTRAFTNGMVELRYEIRDLDSGVPRLPLQQQRADTRGDARQGEPRAVPRPSLPSCARRSVSSVASALSSSTSRENATRAEVRHLHPLT